MDQSFLRVSLYIPIEIFSFLAFHLFWVPKTKQVLTVHDVICSLSLFVYMSSYEFFYVSVFDKFHYLISLALTILGEILYTKKIAVILWHQMMSS